MLAAPTCPACAQAARLTDGVEIYPGLPHLRDKPIWKCDGCGAYVGCHPNTRDALGTPAGPDLRKARSLLHDQMIDPLWRKADESGLYQPEDARARHVIRRTARKRVYEFLAFKLGRACDDTHTAMFDLETCRRAWRALAGVSYPEIRDWAHARRQKEAA